MAPPTYGFDGCQSRSALNISYPTLHGSSMVPLAHLSLFLHTIFSYLYLQSLSLLPLAHQPFSSYSLRSIPGALGIFTSYQPNGAPYPYFPSESFYYSNPK